MPAASEVWLVEIDQDPDDFGNRPDPSVVAVCLTEAKANQIASKLWGHTGPGFPEGVNVTRVATDTWINGK